MSAPYILDACALLAVLSNEPGADMVIEVIKKAASGEVILTISKVNLLEIYYGLFRVYGKAHADAFLGEAKRSPITINHQLSDEVLIEAGRLKATYKMSLADSIALAEASVSGGTLLTADHHEFDAVEKKESIAFLWIR